MGYFRFHKSLRLLPGVRLNASKTGVSWSFGFPGAHLNIARRFIQTTLSLPGTGLSYITRRRRL